MADVKSIETGFTSDVIRTQASDILKPTLHDNDFLKSFVRISLEDNHEESKQLEKGNDSISKENREYNFVSSTSSRMNTPFDDHEEFTDGKINGRDKKKKRQSKRMTKPFLDMEINVQKTRKKRRRKNGVRSEEEIYTDKDRAAAVNMGSRDIKQSLKMKQRQDRNKVLHIPEEAEPSTMLALGAREMHTGDVRIAVNCINKV